MTDEKAGDPAETLGSYAEGAFWQFSLAFYAQAGVAPSCLRLQDEHGLDVNMVLFCLWAGRRGRRLERLQLQDIAAQSRRWQRHAVAPLRQVRRWLKSEPAADGPKVAALRDGIKTLELRAEAIEQERLGRHLPGPDGAADPAAAMENFKAYLAVEAVPWGVDIASLFRDLLDRCFEADCEKDGLA
jgi:uncharacterized protein (TIGR02444 family)